MSNITSSSYPVVTDSKDGDLFAIVRNGQLMKMNRAALTAYIETLAPNTFISLLDAPGSYVGEGGKVVAVNPGETGLTFVTGAANFFVSLSDGPGSYGGKAFQTVQVNAGETALEYIINSLLNLSDFPDSYAGQANKVLVVNPGATGVDLYTKTEAAPATNTTNGSLDVQHSGATQAYTGGAGFVKVLNDGLGSMTRSDLAPDGVTNIWDAINSQFDFSEFSVGDNIEVRVDLQVTTTAANQETLGRLYFDFGGTPFSLQFGRSQFKTAGTYTYTVSRRFYVGYDATINNPIEVQFSSDANATLALNGFAVLAERRKV